MADYCSCNEAEWQRVKNNENAKAQTEKAKITYIENSSTRRRTYSRCARNLVIAVSI